MRLPDKATSRAVLIGNGTFTSDLLDIGAVESCLTDLSLVLSGTTDAPFAPEHCVTIADARDGALVLKELGRAARAADDVLLLYYVGHSLTDGSGGDLYFALRDTTFRDLPATGLAFEDVRAALTASKARMKIVIFDCDFSPETQRRLDTHGRNGIRSIKGLVAFTASTVAQAPGPDDAYTAFTGELLSLLVTGAPEGPALLDPVFIHARISDSLRALGLRSPQTLTTRPHEDIALARNVAFMPEGSSETGAQPRPERETSGAAASSEPSRPASRSASSGPSSGPSSVEPIAERPEEEVEWTADAAETRDLLHRGPVATVIAMQLVDMRRAAPHLSFFTHIDGAWGTGKSTMLNLLRERMAGHFAIVDFDAWQQSRLGPPWWSLLTATRRQVLRGRPWLRVRETASRMRRTGAPFGLALVLVLAIAAVVAYVLWPRQHSLQNWSESVKALLALVAALGTLVTSALVASRFLLFDSVRGAKLFEQTQANPIREIAAHFRWLLKRSHKPVAFFVDDLDRCQQAYVVDFLDTAQTMIRDTTREPAPYFVVAADGAWLRRSYEKAHSDFAGSLERPGRPIGYLFLDKLFQLTVPMPVLTESAQAVYLDAILRIEQPGMSSAESGPGRASSAGGAGDPSGLRERLRLFEEGRARQAAGVGQSPEERRRTEHILRRFAHLLGNNPRSVKRFLNTYSILHSIRRLEGNLIEPETLALWTILVVRWPAIAAHLQDEPDAVQGILQPLWVEEHFPESLLDLARAPELRDIMTCETGGPLTAAAIRQCVGLSLGGG